MGVIYKTVNLINGKIYVGRNKHNNPKYLGSGTIIQLAFQKYGLENFKKEILEECENHLLDEREKFWIKELKSQDPLIGYNIADGGHNDFTMNDYIKDKISKSLKGKYTGVNAFRYGIQLSEEHRERFLERAMKLKGKTLEEFYGEERANEIKKKISDSHSGVPLSQKHCESISKAKKGVPLTDKQKEGISKGMMGREISELTKKKLRDSNLNKKQKHSIEVNIENLETGEIIHCNNISQATRTLNVTFYKIQHNLVSGYNITLLK